MKHPLIVQIVLFVLFCSCSLQEKDVEHYETIKEVNLEPILASFADSLKKNEAKSSIQRSPEYILASFTVCKDGLFVVEISEEELNILGVSENSFQDYIKGLSTMNNSHHAKAE